MNSNNNCKNRREAIAALVLDELEPQAADDLREHIAACQICRSLYQALTDEEELIRSAVGAMAERSKNVQDNLIGRLEKRTPAQSPTVVTSTLLRVFGSRIAKLAVAAVIVVAVLAAYVLPSSMGAKAYGAAMKALQNVSTVHVSGWTTKVQPTHSSALDEPLDVSKQYPVEIWEWFSETGDYRRYERRGPIILWDDPDRCYEYHSHKDRLYVGQSQKNRLLSIRFQSMTDRLDVFRQRGVEFTDLGVRVIGGRQATGLRGQRQNEHKDIWLDRETNLLLENNAFMFTNGRWVQYLHFVVAYDQNVPSEIGAYVPPDANNVFYDWDIDPRFEKWHLHLRRLAAHYEQNPLPGRMELIPRELDEEIENAYAPGRLPGITEKSGYWVLPVRSSLRDFLRVYFRPVGCLRMPKDLQNIELNHDLVTSNDFSQQERIDFVLEAMGLQVVEMTEQRKVWVAHYDGRVLKPWRQVKAPVANPHNQPSRAGMACTFGPASITDLFDSLCYWQDLGLEANKIVIVDETGLPSETGSGGPPDAAAVSSESPLWVGEESLEIARKWFEQEFGVTFSEETREMPVYVVERR